MCIELAFKKAKIPIMRSFVHGTEAVLSGMPAEVRKRFIIHFKAKKYLNGKVDIAQTKIYTTASSGFTAWKHQQSS